MHIIQTRCICVVICLLLIAAAPLGCKSKPSPEEQKASAEAVARALSFRFLAAEDYKNALSKLASSEEIRKKFDAFDEALWPSVKPAEGWSYFFNTSLMTLGPDTPEGLPVAFYHPWSDVYLITLWKTSEADKTQLVDAELMMGDIFRHRGARPDIPQKMWMRSEIYLPAAIGIAAAKSAKSFEDVFKNGDVANWRSQFQGMDDPANIDAGRYGAGFLMLGNLGEIAAFPFGTTTNPVPDELSAAIVKTFDSMNKGDFGSLIFTSPDTLPETREVLSTMDDALWNAFRLVGFQSNSERAVILLSNAANPGLYMSLVFEKKGTDAVLARIDMLDFQTFYSKTPEKLLKEVS